MKKLKTKELYAIILDVTPYEYTDEEKVEFDIAEIALPVRATEKIELPLEGAKYQSVISWASSNEGVISTAGVVKRPAAGQADVTVTLTATITLGEYTTTETYEITVVAEVADGVEEEFEATYNLVNFSGFDWSTSYGAKTISSTATGVGLPAATIELSTANKQTQTITDRPVLRAKGTTEYATFKLTESGKEIKAVTYDFVRWASDTTDGVTIEYKNSEGTWVVCSAKVTDLATGTISSNIVLPEGVTEVRLVLAKSATTNCRIGLSAIKVTVA